MHYFTWLLPLLLVAAGLMALALAAATVRWLYYKGVLQQPQTGAYEARPRVKRHRVFHRMRQKKMYSS